MDGVPATYLGRHVSKEHFRAFIYAPDGQKKLVESWKEFESHMQTGIWFATKEDAVAIKAIEVEQAEKPKKARPKPVKEVVVQELKEELEDEPVVEDDLAFEVKEDDDFLPKGK